MDVYLASPNMSIEDGRARDWSGRVVPFRTISFADATIEPGSDCTTRERELIAELAKLGARFLVPIPADQAEAAAAMIRGGAGVEVVGR